MKMIASVWMWKREVILVNGLVLSLPKQVLLSPHHYYENQCAMPDHGYEEHRNVPPMTLRDRNGYDTSIVIHDGLVVTVAGAGTMMTTGVAVVP